MEGFKLMRWTVMAEQADAAVAAVSPLVPPAPLWHFVGASTSACRTCLAFVVLFAAVVLGGFFGASLVSAFGVLMGFLVPPAASSTTSGSSPSPPSPASRGE